MNQEYKTQVMEENVYVESCLSYTLSNGWLKPEQEESLVRDCLKPIHDKYTEILGEVRSEAPEELPRVIGRLNAIMESTRRIGSTDPSNITRSMEDFYGIFCTGSIYPEYASRSLIDRINKLIQN